MNNVPRMKGGTDGLKHMWMYTPKRTHSCQSADEFIWKEKWAAGLRQ